MNQLFLHKGKPVVFSVPEPVINKNSVLVQVMYSFISSGTELAIQRGNEKNLLQKFTANIQDNCIKLHQTIKEHGIQGTYALLEEKHYEHMPIGYSCSGKVIAVGSQVTGVAVGDYVACAGSESAYHAEVVNVPYNLVARISNKDFCKQASIATIGAIALQGIRRAQIQLGESVCIMGLGLLGQLSVQLAKLSGAHVIGLDIHAERLKQALGCGAYKTIDNSNTASAATAIMQATDQRGVDVTIITAASASGLLLQQAMEITRKKGRVVIVGDVGLDFERNPFYSKEIDLLISCSYGPGRYDAAYEQQGNDYPYAYVRWTEQRNLAMIVNLIETGALDVQALCNAEFTVTQAETAFATLKNGTILGALLTYTEQSKKAVAVEVPLRNTQLYAHKIRVGVVGVGGFCKTKLLPIIKNIRNVHIAGLVDASTAKLASLSHVYKAARLYNSHTNIVHNQDIDVVLIATPHVQHAQQAIDSLAYGKAVFLEKPAAVSFEQLEALKTSVEKYNATPFCVDFNRSFAPFMQKIKQHIIHRSNPMMLLYRMNVGLLPMDHWIQSHENKGRLIGEACHIFDLFCFLTDSLPRTMQVSSIKGSGATLATDNVAIQCVMNDGSVCTLLYTAIGHNAMSKEYMELFVDSMSIIMDDFKTMRGFGVRHGFDQTVQRADKGHTQLLHAFFDALHKQKPMPLSFQRIYAATLMSLVADNLARQGGGIFSFDNSHF